MPGWAYLIALITLVALALLLARRAFLVVRVSGPSMQPTLHHGDAVLAVRTGLPKRLRPDDIIVCRLPPSAHHPDSLVIKRIREMEGGSVFVVGDGPHSYDSRQFGPIAAGQVVGRVIAHLRL